MDQEWIDTPFREAVDAANACLQEYRQGRGRLRILEAGCGSCRRFELGDAWLLGVDISPEQLSRQESVDETILGDIQDCALPEASFDVAVCWMVLEHLDRPLAALDNLRRALKPGGLLVLGMPNPLSAKGLFTRLTPHRIHVLYYRKVEGLAWAGTEGRGPFRTTMHLAISPQGLRRYAERAGLEVLLMKVYEDQMQRRLRTRSRALHLAGRALSLTRHLAPGGFDVVADSECVCILRVQP